MMTNAFKVLLIILFAILMLTMVGCGGGIRPPAPPAGKQDQSIDSILVWLSAVAVLGIGASIAAAVFLPIKKLSIAGVAGFGSILGCALLVKAALPFLPWIALGLVLLLVGAAIYYFSRYVLATHEAVRFGHDVAAAVTDEDVEATKQMHARIQDDSGVRGIITSALKSVKGKSQ